MRGACVCVWICTQDIICFFMVAIHRAAFLYSRKKINTISFCAEKPNSTIKDDFVTRVAIDETTLKAIDYWSKLTYAPSTEQSRNLGAGSEISDND